MIALLTGQVAEQEEKSLIIDVNGVGYRVAVLSISREKIKTGQGVTLHIFHHVGQDSEALYGFATKKDLRYFELLLTVPSVGPKTAMNILDIAPPDTLARAVASGDVKILTKISGIGKKTAERILVELKEKLDKVEGGEKMGDIQEETMSALINMGYTRAQAREAVQKLATGVNSVEEAVRKILKRK